MSHHCHAHGCQTEVPPEMLMCGKHWRIVPKNIQRQVWAHYRAGQCDDKNPSAEWHRAADLAIAYVAEREGHRAVAERYRTFAANATRQLQAKQQGAPPPFEVKR